jgi:hypothetical protein
MTGDRIPVTHVGVGTPCALTYGIVMHCYYCPSFHLYLQYMLVSVMLCVRLWARAGLCTTLANHCFSVGLVFLRPGIVSL